MDKNRQNGIYYTELKNPFKSDYFVEWINKNKIKDDVILEPFAGGNNIPHFLNHLKFKSFDIVPTDKNVIKRDTILYFPKNFRSCITNPPWLYKSSAKRRNLEFCPNCSYDDIYKYCIELCLKNCDYVCALLPASFINSNLFQERLSCITFVTKKLFTETDSPTCIATFNKSVNDDILIFEDNNFLGSYNEFKKYLPPKSNLNLKFNAKEGELGLIGIDNTKEASIKFLKGSDIKKDIKNTSRSITRIKGIDLNSNFLRRINDYVYEFRKNTKDVFLTAFKGIRADGHYRRRIDYNLARNIIADCL